MLIGGDGGHSGVPRHIRHLVKAFQPEAQVMVVSDINLGGYDGLADNRATHVAISGLQSRFSLSHLWRGWRGLLRLLKESPADLVWLHARLPVMMGRAALALRLWCPKNSVAVTYHGLPIGPGHKALANHVSFGIEWVLLSLCPPLDLVFLSQSAADQMSQAMGKKRLGRHRIHVLPNCSDLGKLPTRIPSETRRLVMTGRVGWQKNYQLAAQILAHLPEDYHLTLCGAGTDTVEFQSDIASSIPKEVASRIHYAGPVQDVRPYLMAADGYLLCSRYEGMPIGALEAFEAGLPIILSRFEGAEELVSKHPFGITLDFCNMAQDAKQIEMLINSFRTSETQARTEIRAVWKSEWSPDVFSKNARALLNKLLQT